MARRLSGRLALLRVVPATCKPLLSRRSPRTPPWRAPSRCVPLFSMQMQMADPKCSASRATAPQSRRCTARPTRKLPQRARRGAAHPRAPVDHCPGHITPSTAPRTHSRAACGRAWPTAAGQRTDRARTRDTTRTARRARQIPENRQITRWGDNILHAPTSRRGGTPRPATWAKSRSGPDGHNGPVRAASERLAARRRLKAEFSTVNWYCTHGSCAQMEAGRVSWQLVTPN